MRGKHLFGLAFLALAVAADADQLDTWNLMVGAGMYTDSNLFRRPAADESSDTITTLNAGIRINKPISMQRFVVDASVTDFRYDKNSYLNYLGKNATATWQWSLTPQVHGNLSKTYSEAMNNFLDYWSATPALRKNIRTTDTTRFDVEWEAFGRLHPVAGITHSELKNGQTFLAEQDYTSDAIEYGLKYVLPTGSQITIVERQTDGEYKNRSDVNFYLNGLDTGFSQHDLELRFAWELTDKSTLSGRVAHIDRKHDHFSVHDYDGMIGSLDYTLDLTGKIRISTGYKRDLAAFQSGLINYQQSDTYYVSPIWQISGKTALRGRYNQDSREYRNDTTSFFKDKLKQYSVSLDWSPLRTLTLSATAQRDTRDSSNAVRNFSSNALIFSANFMF